MRSVFKLLLAGMLSIPALTSSAQYCYGAGPSDCSGAWYIDLVKLSGENGSSINHASVCESYADNTAQFAYLLAGTSYTVTVSTAAAASNVAVFVDWNNDGILSDTTEIYPGVSTIGADATILIVPPTGTADGPKRMRVRAVSYIGVPSSCNEQTFGEVEDYTLFFYNVADSIPSTAGPTGSYCSAAGPSNCAQVDGSGTGYPITKVAISGDNGTAISNTSGCDMYGDFTSKSVTLSVGNPYTLAVTGGNAFGLTATWIDWNEDFDFADPGEEYTEYNYNISLDALVTVITPPADVVPGIKRMRIRATGILPPEPCGVQYIGEVEDYTVIVFNPLNPTPDCATGFTPVDSSTNNCQNLRLSWQQVSNAAKYKVKIFSSGLAIKDTIVVDPELFLKGLTSSTDYQWLVIPVDSDNVSAIGCDTLLFTTSANQDPTVEINFGADTLMPCADEDVLLNAQVNLGTSPYLYDWTTDDDAHMSALDTASPTYNTSVPGNYHVLVQVRDANGCAAIDSAVITVNPRPQISSFSSDKGSYCQGDSVLLLVASDGTYINFYSSVDQNSYSPLTPIDNGSGHYQVNNLQDSSWFRLIVGNDFGCTDVKEIAIVVHPTPVKPVLSASKYNFCPSDSSTISVINYTEGINWSNGVQTTSQTVNIAGSYLATYTDSFGCFSISDTIHLNYHPVPDSLVIKRNQLEYCGGDTGVLYYENNPGYSVIWSDGVTTGDSLMITSAGTFYFTATNGYGCSTQAPSQSVIFQAKPSKPAIFGASRACNGTTIVLTASGGSFVWNTGETTAKINVTTDGTYSVQSVSVFGCKSDTASKTVEFESRPDTVSITQIGDSMYVTPADSQYKYRWLNEQGGFLKETTGAYKPTKSGRYKVVVISASGCASDTSSLFTFAGVGIDRVGNSEILVYPQPASDELYIELPKGDESYLISFTDLSGRIINTLERAGGKQKFDIQLSKGWYLLRIESDTVKKSLPIIID